MSAAEVTAVSRLIRCYEDAAFQRYLMYPRTEDLALVEGGWKVFHAIDTNVVACYLEPADHATKSDYQIIGVGEVFREDLLETKENIARLVSEFILFGLNPQIQLIALRPINIEIKDMYLKLANQFLSGVAPRVKIDDKLLARLEAVATQRHTEKIQEYLEEILRADLRGEAAVQRIRNITRARRLLGSDMVTAGSHSPALAAAMPSDRRTADQMELVPRAALWMKRLEQVGRKAERPPAKRDAEALAKLQLANERLSECQADERLVYITGDNSLLDAGEVFQWDGPNGTSNFSREFIRHPRAYLDEPDVLRPSGESCDLDADTLYGWLTLLLGRIRNPVGDIRPSRGLIEFPQPIIHSLHEIAAEDPEAASKIMTKWKAYAQEAFRDAPESFVKRLIAALESQAAAELVERTWEEYKGDKSKTWDDVLEVTAGARFALEVWSEDQRSSTPARETPSLVFEGRTALHRFLKSAEQWLDDSHSFKQEDYDSLRLDVQREEDGVYGDYMAHAYLLAQQRQWKSAQILASLATSKASNFTGTATGSNGRESSYLEAYCGRLTSTSKDELKKPTASILRALKVARREQAATEAANRRHDCAHERFVAEMLVLRMTKYLYEWSDGLERRAELEAMRLRFGALARRIHGRIEALPADKLAPPYDEQRIRAGLRSALGRCYRSGLGLALQLGRIDHEARQMWVGLKGLIAEEKDNYPSQFAKFVVKLADLLFIDSSSVLRRQRELGNLQWRLPTTVLPYDERRYKTMIEAVGAYLSATAQR
jgi:hypothetical protein